MTTMDATAEARFAYERVAGEIVRLIDGGTLRPGDRVPSVRRLSTQRGVSISTVVQAYRILEDRRVIRARPKSGYYVLEPRAVAAPARSAPAGAPREVSTVGMIVSFLQEVSRAELVPLGVAYPAPELLPTARLARLIGAVSRRWPERSATLVSPTGCEELRHAIARRELEAGCRTGDDGVIATVGCSEAVSLALRAVAGPGDAIAVESPTYFGLLQGIESLHMRAVEVPMSPETGICLDALESLLSRGAVKAVVVTPHFQNPIGSRMPDEHKRAVVELASRHGVAVIEDDTYGELSFGEGPRPRSLQAFDAEGWVMRCGSFSKTVAPGYRMGWISPGRFRDAVMRLKCASTVSTAAPVQLALAEYLATGGYDAHLRRLRRTFQVSVARMAHEVAARFPGGTRISRPAGGFVLWVQLPGAGDTRELYRRANLRGVSVAPGPVFSPTCAYTDCIRLSAGHPWSDRIDAALDVLAELAHEGV